MHLPLVLHIPHASRDIPSDVRRSILLDDRELGTEVAKMTDAYTDELFALDSQAAFTVVFPVSRIVLDPERFLDDDQEMMSSRGMGVIYTRTSDGRRLRHPPAEKERDALIETYYHPHHEKLEACVRACLESEGCCTIVDCHSFPSQPLPCDFDQTVPRPDICIGTDAFHTPDWLRMGLCCEFEKLGWSTQIDAPFAGTIVPLAYFRQSPSVRSVMIEVNRKLYMDEQTGRKTHTFDIAKRRIAQILEKIEALKTE